MSTKVLALLLLGLFHIALGVRPGLLSRQAPTIKLGDATVTGATTGNVAEFLGIPFAQPPVNNLRFQLPQLIQSYNESVNATAFGPACPQQLRMTSPFSSVLAPEAVAYLEFVFAVFAESEDCLTINVVKPATATPESKLPVAVWIYGGGYEFGGTSSYPGSVIVERSIELGEPVVYVSMNYRVNGFGFLGGKEVQAAGVGNLGLQDQRAALRWVQQFITSFGGDPTKVTIFGESSGSVSVGLQMITNGGNTEGLFRGAFMESGTPISIPDIIAGQALYDFVVDETGCANDTDTLACLRTVPYATLGAVFNQTPSLESSDTLSLVWEPSVDGVFFTESPTTSFKEGRIARIPFVNGDNDDEGTIFSVNDLNITTDAEFKQFIQTQLLSGLSDNDTQKLAELYPSDPAAGSPFGTGQANALTPQYKRIAAVQGDLDFHAPRRTFLQALSSGQTAFSYLSLRNKTLPDFGSAHASDLSNIYGPGDMTTYFVRFANSLNPNGAGTLFWPQYNTSSPKLLTFADGPVPQTIADDTFRQEAIALLQEIELAAAGS